MKQKPDAVASTDQLGLMPERDLPTMADVLDALTVFNKPAEGDEPWSATQFIAVTALPEFIHNVGRAWYGRFALEMAVAAERERWTEAVMAELDGNGQAQAIVAYATRA